MAKRIDLAGQTFGQLTVLARADYYVAPGSGNRQSQWLCRCTCGAEVVRRQAHLRNGRVSSCGCLVTRRGGAHPAWRGADVGYSAAHRRVYRERGSASQHRCIDCEGEAAQWSYTKDCTDERVGEAGNGQEAPYCPGGHAECYVPRCVTCHWIYDNKKEAA